MLIFRTKNIKKNNYLNQIKLDMALIILALPIVSSAFLGLGQVIKACISIIINKYNCVKYE